MYLASSASSSNLCLTTLRVVPETGLDFKPLLDEIVLCIREMVEESGIALLDEIVDVNYWFMRSLAKSPGAYLYPPVALTG